MRPCRNRAAYWRRTEKWAGSLPAEAEAGKNGRRWTQARGRPDSAQSDARAAARALPAARSVAFPTGGLRKGGAAAPARPSNLGIAQGGAGGMTGQLRCSAARHDDAPLAPVRTPCTVRRLRRKKSRSVPDMRPAPAAPQVPPACAATRQHSAGAGQGRSRQARRLRHGGGTMRRLPLPMPPNAPSRPPPLSKSAPGGTARAGRTRPPARTASNRRGAGRARGALEV